MDDAPRSTASRLGWAWAVAFGIASVVVLALAGPRPAVAVAVVGVLGGLWVRWALLRELAGFTSLSRQLDAAVAGRGGLDAGLAGDAGRLSRSLASLLARLEQVEAGQRATRARLDELLEATPSGVVVVAPNGRIEAVNSALVQRLALHRDPVGLRALEGLHAVEVAEAIEEALAGREPPARDLAVAERDLSVSAHPLAGGGALALIADVSDERIVERARTDFVANVSHELRTPIAAILGFAETLLDTPGGLPPEIGVMGRAIHRNALRLRRLFEDLLALHRIETRRQDLPREEIGLEALLGEALGATADAAAAKGVGFAVEVDPSLKAWANPQALTAIVTNLAGNAVKYTLTGGRVDVRAEATPDGVRVDVRDTGIGIPRAHQARVFERFYRVDEGRAREVGGTGLGLAIAKHLAEATGCRISLQSEEGRGSTFSVHVPRAAAGRSPRAS